MVPEQLGIFDAIQYPVKPSHSNQQAEWMGVELFLIPGEFGSEVVIIRRWKSFILEELVFQKFYIEPNIGSEGNNGMRDGKVLSS